MGERELRVQIKTVGTRQPCPHTGWTWKGHVGSQKSKINIRKSKNQHPSKFGDEKKISPNKIKVQNDRIGKIYRFKKSLDPFSLKNKLSQGIGQKSPVLSLGLN